jgi:hypothetical protein
MYLSTRSNSSSDDGGAEDATLALELFKQSMATADTYPQNIAYSRNYDYQLAEYARQLDDDRSKLFGTQNIVDFLEFREGTRGTGKLDSSLLQFFGKPSHGV